METKFVRRLDDLGRVVVPKEFRRRFRIKEGDAVEFSVDGESLKITPYNYFSAAMREVDRVINTIGTTLQLPVAFCNETEIVAVAGLSRPLMMHAKIITDVIYRDKVYDSSTTEQNLHPIEDNEICARFIQPVFSKDLHVIGTIIVFEPYNFLPECEEFSNESAKMLLASYATYLEDLIGGMTI